MNRRQKNPKIYRKPVKFCGSVNNPRPALGKLNVFAAVAADSGGELKEAGAQFRDAPEKAHTKLTANHTSRKDVPSASVSSSWSNGQMSRQ